MSAKSVPYTVRVPENGDSVIRIFYEQTNLRRLRLAHIADKAGISRAGPTQWRKGTDPRLTIFRACLNVMGLDLAVVDKKTGKIVGGRLDG